MKQNSNQTLAIEKILVIGGLVLAFVATITSISFLLIQFTNIDSLIRQILGFVCGGIVVSGIYMLAGGNLTKIIENTNPYFAQKKYRKAIQLYEQIIQKDPQNYKLLYRIGFSYTMLNENEKALKYYEDALKIKQDDPTLLINVGYAYHRKGDYENAIKFADEALKIKKDYDVALYYKAATKYLQNNKEEAAALLKKAISQDPSKYKKLLKKDPDFDYIRKDEKFKKMLE